MLEERRIKERRSLRTYFARPGRARKRSHAVKQKEKVVTTDAFMFEKKLKSTQSSRPRPCERKRGVEGRKNDV